MDSSAINIKKTSGKVSAHSSSVPYRDLSINELILTRVRLYAQRRIGWLRNIWNDTQNEINYHKTVDRILSQKDTTIAELKWQVANPDLQEINQHIKLVENAIESKGDSNLAILSYRFGLSEEEKDMLQAIIALRIEPQLETVYAYLQDHSGRGYVTGFLVSRLFGYRLNISPGPMSPSRIWNIITKKEEGGGSPAHFGCDEHIFQWLMGGTDLDRNLLGIGYFIPCRTPLNRWPVQSTAQYISEILKSEPYRIQRIIVKGNEGSGRKTFATCVSGELGMSLLVINADKISNQSWDQVFMFIQREAFLKTCAIAWSGKNLADQPWPDFVSYFKLQFIICTPGENFPPKDEIVDLEVSIPSLTIDERRELWKQYVPESLTWPVDELKELVSRYQVTIGQIISVAHNKVKSAREAGQLLKNMSRHQMGHLAHILECPFAWEDLIVSDWLKKYLEDFIFEAREREKFWEKDSAKRLFPQGKGLIALFTGPPGTGKTMASQVLAKELGLDLFRIDLSTVVSKYVGETSKNMQRILSRAKQMNAVLLFDEADALFGKRTEVKDAHDRYSNTDTNFLLQAIESYPGIAVLASNKKGNIDTGFIRRIRFILEFSKPGVEQRFEIWRRNVLELAGDKQLEILLPQLRFLAKTVELTGAQIKFAILSAMFRSKKERTDLSIQHILMGLERELTKEGRGLSQELKDKINKNNSL